MPMNGSGTYAAPASSWNPAVDGVAINSTDWAALLADITTALSTAVYKDGQQTMTAIVPFAAGITLSGGSTLSAYAQGTWTPADGSGAGLSLTNNTTAQYIKIGRFVIASFDVTYPSTVNGANSLISGLPFASMATFAGQGVFFAFQNVGAGTMGRVVQNSTTFNMSSTGGVSHTNATLSLATIRGSAIYISAT